MNRHSGKIQAPSNFKLLEYIQADLIRSLEIKHGDNTVVTGLRLWLGIFSPRFLPVLFCRLAHWFYVHRMSPVAKFFSLLNFFLFGIEIAVRCPIGKGVYFPHTHGTVIGAFFIGEKVTIFQGVTLGALEVDLSYAESKRPSIEDGVVIGSGAKILGGVTLGTGSRIGANAVVLVDVPSDALAVGVPAKIL